MNCVEFGFDQSRGFGSVGGQFWPIAIDWPTRPYNIASTTVQQVINSCRQNSFGNTVAQSLLDKFWMNVLSLATISKFPVFSAKN
jgi:hypothetical protein